MENFARNLKQENFQCIRQITHRYANSCKLVFGFDFWSQGIVAVCLGTCGPFCPGGIWSAPELLIEIFMLFIFPSISCFLKLKVLWTVWSFESHWMKLGSLRCQMSSIERELRFSGRTWCLRCTAYVQTHVNEGGKRGYTGQIYWNFGKKDGIHIPI